MYRVTVCKHSDRGRFQKSSKSWEWLSLPGEIARKKYHKLWKLYCSKDHDGTTESLLHRKWEAFRDSYCHFFPFSGESVPFTLDDKKHNSSTDVCLFFLLYNDLCRAVEGERRRPSFIICPWGCTRYRSNQDCSLGANVGYCCSKIKLPLLMPHFPSFQRLILRSLYTV